VLWPSYNTTAPVGCCLEDWGLVGLASAYAGGFSSCLDFDLIIVSCNWSWERTVGFQYTRIYVGSECYPSAGCCAKRRCYLTRSFDSDVYHRSNGWQKPWA